MDDDDLLSLLPQRLDLPRGRSALSGSEVAASRRGRILQATLEEIAESGYAATTVAAITKRAHVSRTAFYEAFRDKEEAFAAAHWSASELALTRVWTPALSVTGTDYDARIRAAIESYVGVLEAAPSFAICVYVEIRAAGERLQVQRDEMTDRHLLVLREIAEASAPSRGIVVPPDDDLRALMGAFDELIGRAVRAQRHADSLDLRSVVAPLTRVLLAVMRGGDRPSA